MARLYSNENFPIPVVVALRLLGHDVVTIQERGRASEAVSDPEVLQLATQENRAIVTFNRKDFYRLHASNLKHAGIIVCVVDPDFDRLARAIHQEILIAGELAGRIIRVPPRPSSRPD
ncbi:DUF5615 family PIN-like protein [Tuwongella immobilis]|uniref:DUF5615 family PIN-like protein n=1 Tax=Tuwongella immobilis TaxID=692036 RepID=UPI0013A6F578|nr:DUF5615 family PIN-like protein [Tuwongella immobilis]